MNKRLVDLRSLVRAFPRSLWYRSPFPLIALGVILIICSATSLLLIRATMPPGDQGVPPQATASSRASVEVGSTTTPSPPISMTTPSPTATSFIPTQKKSTPPVASPTPTTHPSGAGPTCPRGAVNGNPWCYTFTAHGGTLVFSPNAAFCSRFRCVSTFWQDGRGGYVVECRDGAYSHAGGRPGVCSHDGGLARPLYKH